MNASERYENRRGPHPITKGLLGVPIFLLLFGFTYYQYISLPAASARDAQPIIVSVPQDMSTRAIGRLLEEEGIIRNARHFEWLNRLLGLDKNNKAGDYLLSADMDLHTIVNRLQDGQVHAVRVMVPEGLHLRQIADLLARRDLVDRERFLAVASDERLVFGDDSPIEKPVVSLEGFLFPDTYLLSRSMTEEDIVRIMVNRFNEVITPVIEAHAAPLDMTLHEVVTLASIVEKEALYNHEHPTIASVFVNRLTIDMPLQADPTVAYLFDEHRSRLLFSDLEIESPYNTYRNRGLPPGPIASPGLSAVQAVLEPEQTDLFFFIARGDGTHIFTRTFDEHVNVRRQLGR